MKSMKQMTKTKKWWVGIPIVLGIFLIAILTLGGRTISTLSSLRQISGTAKGEDALYTMDYTSSYSLSNILESGATTPEDLASAINHQLFLGLNTAFSLPTLSAGGAAFDAESSPDTHVMGQRIESLTQNYLLARNYNGPATSALLIRSTPRSGYASLAMSSLPGNLLNTASYARLLAAPLLSTDGVNDQGLSVAAIRLSDPPTQEKNDLLPITTTLAVRMMLDQCATVQEAVVLLGNYDMTATGDHSYAFLIADKTGDSTVVEYPKHKMATVSSTIATDRYQSKGAVTKGSGDQEAKTFKAIQSAIAATKKTVSEKEAFAILKKTAVTQGDESTRWSVVYDLYSSSASVVFSQKWDHPYTLTLPEN